METHASPEFAVTPSDPLLVAAEKALGRLDRGVRRSLAGRRLAVMVDVLRERAERPSSRWLADLQSLADHLFDIETLEAGAWRDDGSVAALSALHDAIAATAFPPPEKPAST